MFKELIITYQYLILEPITCTVYPSNITVESNEETINVTVKISSNNPLPDIQLEPSWGMVEAINNSIYKVSGLINTTGEHKILHVTQKIGLLNNSIVTKASCFVFVTTTGKNKLGFTICDVH